MKISCSFSDRFRGTWRPGRSLLGLPLLALLAACSEGSPTPASNPQTSAGSAGIASTSTGGGGSGAPAGGSAATSGAGGGAGSAQSGAAGAAGAGGNSGAAGAGGGGAGTGSSEDFSFFVTSMAAMVELSGNDQGFGGDLTYDGKAGVLGADEICKAIAERSMPGSGAKGWKAFLSTSTENAIDRISGGPWFDRQGRLIANDKEALRSERPEGSDPAVTEDLPNEDGVPNHLDINPACKSDNSCRDNHDTLTGSDQNGELDPQSTTCDDWTSLTAAGKPRIGHSWSAQSGKSWIMAHQAGGCGRSVHVDAGGGPQPGDLTVGAGGGYGGFYCFASMR